MRLRVPAIIAQRGQQGVGVGDAASGTQAATVVTIQVVSAVHGAVGQGEDVAAAIAEDTAPTTNNRVADGGGVGQHGRAIVDDAAAVVGRIVGEGAVPDGQRAIVEDAAAVGGVGGRIAGECP